MFLCGKFVFLQIVMYCLENKIAGSDVRSGIQVFTIKFMQKKLFYLFVRLVIQKIKSNN